jgi:cytoskeletal protein RodZ
MQEAQVCPHCGQIHPPDTRFCTITGKALAPVAPAPRRHFSLAPLLILIGLAVVGIVGVLMLGVGLWQFFGGTFSMQRLPTVAAVSIISTTSPVPATETRFAPTPTIQSSATSAPLATATLFPTTFLPTPSASLATATLISTSSLLTPSATATPLALWSACPDTLLSRLRVGYHAYVTYDPPDPNRVREQPGTQSRVLGQIQPGEEIEILEGPSCVNGWVWWKVRSQKTGLTGWTAEGNKNIYWLVPLATPVPSGGSGPRFYNFFVCTQPCLDGGSNATRTFSTGITKLYARWNYDNVPVGAHYIRDWTMNGDEWVRYDCSWPSLETGIDQITLSEPGGLHSGTWEVTISINGTVLLREQVVVEGNWSYWSPAGVFNSCYGK